MDHVDENRGNDHPSNLRLMSEQDSRKQGRRIQADKQYESWRLFFEYIEFCGHAPPEDSPYWEA